MRKLLALLIIILAAGLTALPAQEAAAQSRGGGDLSSSLQRLQNNPRYRGRIIGTQIRHTERGALYEVHILRPDDRVIVVYIDPATGGVVGDSERRSRGRGPGQRGRGNN